VLCGSPIDYRDVKLVCFSLGKGGALP